MSLDHEAIIHSPAEPAPGPPEYRWYHKLGALLFVIFCFELGVFLIVFPWLDLWDVNWLASFSPAIHRLWMNPYFRGALSGIGVLNVYISLVEVFHLRRFNARRK
jgi:hypothetical protein